MAEEDDFKEEDVMDNRGYKDEEFDDKKSKKKKEKPKGHMTRKEAENYPKIGDEMKKNEDTMKAVAAKTGIPEDFLTGVGPELGNFLSKYIFMAVGGKGTALDPEKLKWIKDLQKDLAPVLKSFYKYIVKRQMDGLGITPEDQAMLLSIQAEQGPEAALQYLKEKAQAANKSEAPALPEGPVEYQSEDGSVTAVDDRQVPLDPDAPPPARLQPRKPGLPTIEEMAAEAGVNPTELRPKGDMHTQKTKATAYDMDNIVTMLEDEKNRIRSGDLYSERKPSDYKTVDLTGTNASQLENLTLPGSTEIMKAMNEDATRMKQEAEDRIKARKEGTTDAVPEQLQTEEVSPELARALDADLSQGITVQPEPVPPKEELPIPEDFPNHAKLKSMHIGEVEDWARKIKIQPAKYNSKEELIDAIIKVVEGG